MTYCPPQILLELKEGARLLVINQPVLAVTGTPVLVADTAPAGITVRIVRQTVAT